MNEEAPAERPDSTGAYDIPAGLSEPFILGLAILFGAGLRLVIVLSADFPYNDGGLFFTLVNELSANGFRLPEASAYNAMRLPAVYPPLAFYLTGLINQLLGISVIQLQRGLPLIFSILAIPAFALLSKAIIKSPGAAALATLAFALLPNSFDRMLMGGGLTRAPGFFFGLLALYWIHALFNHGGWKNLSLAIVFSTLTALTHPVYAWFVFYSAGVFFLFTPQKSKNFLRGLMVAGGVVILCAPWWATILNNHGPAPILGAFQSRQALPLIVSISQLLLFDLSREFFLEILGVISLIGLAITLFNRNYLWLTWLLAIFLLERTSPVALAVIPLAQLTGIGGQKLILASRPAWENPRRRRFALIAFSLLIYYSLVSSYLSYNAAALGLPIRQAMAWTKENTPPGSRFLVFTNLPWWDDPVTEWFPALSARTSVTTVQGYEWTDRLQFAMQSKRFDQARNCLWSIDVGCLDAFETEGASDYDYLFVPRLLGSKGQPAVEHLPLVESLRESPNFTIVYDEAGALIFTKK